MNELSMKSKQLLIVLVLLLGHLTAYSSSPEARGSGKEFRVVGFHLDLRIQVMKPEALKAFASELFTFGINTIVMEWEATFPFGSHPLIPNKYAYTKEEIADFISHCGELGIDVIPLQQSLGHVEYILRHARYADQREDHKDVSQLCPLEAELNRALFTDLFTEMAELHPSKYFHIGGDEAYLFGDCRDCSRKVEEEGQAKLLADHLKLICDIVVSLDKIPVLWADVANKYPEELSRLPKETIFLVWNYGWALDRFGDPENIVKKGFEVWGAPSLRSNPDNFYLTRWNYHLENMRDFIPLCRESGYQGMIMTSWSTSGIYSTIFEDKQTITELVPVRHVYPISGFRILVAAYGQALSQQEGLDIEEFIISYCGERYGFSSKEALEFWEAIQGMPYQVIDGRIEGQPGLSVGMLLASAREDQATLNRLAPQQNTDEFEHFRLMKDIRENYLSFKQIEARVNQEDFNPRKIPEVLGQLEGIMEKDEAIKARFTELNQDLLHAGQIEEENQVRIERVRLLYERLGRIH